MKSFRFLMYIFTIYTRSFTYDYIKKYQYSYALIVNISNSFVSTSRFVNSPDCLYKNKNTARRSKAGRYPFYDIFVQSDGFICALIHSIRFSSCHFCVTAASHSASLKPVSTFSPVMSSGRFTSMPSEARSLNISSSLISGSFFESSMDR